MQEIAPRGLPKRDRKNAGCIVTFVALCLVFLAIGLTLQRNMPHVDATATANRSDACFMAQKFAKDELKAPSTAKFASCAAPDTTVTQTERIWNVRSFVDAQNSFGAQLRNRFTAKLIYYPAKDTWTLVSLTFD